MKLYNINKEILYEDTGKTVAESFVNAIRKGINLTGLKLENIHIRGNPKLNETIKVEIPGARLTNCTFENMVFEGDMREAEFVDCLFCNNIFQKVDISESYFNRCVMSKNNIIDSDLKECEFNYCDMSYIGFKSDLSYTVFRNNTISHSKIQDELIQTEWTNNDIDRLTLEADLTKGCFNANNIKNLKLIRCELEDTNFDNNDINKMTFINSVLSGVNFLTNKLKNLNFDSCKLNTVTFNNCTVDNSVWQYNDTDVCFINSKLNNNLYKYNNLHSSIKSSAKIFLVSCLAENNNFINHNSLMFYAKESINKSMKFIDNKSIDFYLQNNNIEKLDFAQSSIDKSTFRNNKINKVNNIGNLLNLIEKTDTNFVDNTLFADDEQQYQLCKEFAMKHPESCTNYQYFQESSYPSAVVELDKHKTQFVTEEDLNKEKLGM